jgi:hypothetical protein
MATYAAFDVKLDNRDGTETLLPSETVHVYDVTNGAALADIASDANGHVAAGSLAVAVGTLIRFSFHRADGLCGYAETLTT